MNWRIWRCSTSLLRSRRTEALVALVAEGDVCRGLLRDALQPVDLGLPLRGRGRCAGVCGEDRGDDCDEQPGCVLLLQAPQQGGAQGRGGGGCGLSFYFVSVVGSGI